jgi:hypothetical protein
VEADSVEAAVLVAGTAAAVAVASISEAAAAPVAAELEATGNIESNL